MSKTYLEHRINEIAEANKALEKAKETEKGNITIVFKSSSSTITATIKPHRLQHIIKKLLRKKKKIISINGIKYENYTKEQIKNLSN